MNFGQLAPEFARPRLKAFRFESIGIVGQASLPVVGRARFARIALRNLQFSRQYPWVVSNLRPSSRWIPDKVFSFLTELVVAARDTVEVFVLPHLAESFVLVLHLTGGKRFPGVKDRPKLKGREPGKQDVDVIVHHHVSGQFITLTVKFPDRRAHQISFAPIQFPLPPSERPSHEVCGLVLPPVGKFPAVKDLSHKFGGASAALVHL
jgi:hypothetical protein